MLVQIKIENRKEPAKALEIIDKNICNLKEKVECLQLYAPKLFKAIMQAIGAIGGGGGNPEVNAIQQGSPIEVAANGATFANGIAKFASGGIVNRPTLFKFASGGAMQTGVMGEAGPEAIMPLKRGADGKLGVAGGGGGTSVVVNVDASGNSQVSGNAGQGEQLGRVISQAVQQELIKQKRPGGILAG